METESEILFKRFCNQNNFECTKITEGQSKTPDYKVTINEYTFLAEVKEISPNEQDIQYHKEFESKGYTVITRGVGNRIRQKISKANSQLKKITNSELPGILILYDNLGFGPYYDLDPINIKAAMFGELQFIFSHPDIIKGDKPQYLYPKYGGKRKFTETCNTTISAIGALDNHSKLSMRIYHNPYASMPLCKHIFISNNIRQFEISGDEWIEIDTSSILY